jgi:hypothetical protein
VASPGNLHTENQLGDNPIMDQTQCPFCHVEKPRIVLDDEFAVAFFDGYPVARGHTLIVPKRHVASLFDLPEQEQVVLWRLVSLVRGKLRSRLEGAALPCDASASIQIASWVYQQTEKANGQVWVMEKVLEHLSPGWQQCLSA